MKRFLSAALLSMIGCTSSPPSSSGYADLIVHHAKVVPSTPVRHRRGRRDQAAASSPSARRRDPQARSGPKRASSTPAARPSCPGLYDSHVHPVGAATSELDDPIPDLQVARRRVRLHRKKRGRAPRRGRGSCCATPSRPGSRKPASRRRPSWTRSRPKHPVLYHAGPAGMVNIDGARRSPASPGTRPTRRPASSSRTRRPASRPACSATPTASLKGVPRRATRAPAEARTREAVKKLFAPVQRARHHQRRRPQRRPRRPRPVPRRCRRTAS